MFLCRYCLYWPRHRGALFLPPELILIRISRDCERDRVRNCQVLVEGSDIMSIRRFWGVIFKNAWYRSQVLKIVYIITDIDDSVLVLMPIKLPMAAHAPPWRLPSRALLFLRRGAMISGRPLIGVTSRLAVFAIVFGRTDTNSDYMPTALLCATSMILKFTSRRRDSSCERN